MAELRLRQRVLKPVRGEIPSPALFRGGAKPAVVNDVGEVTVGDSRFTFSDPSDALQPGTRATLHMGLRDIYCISAEDQEAYDRERKLADERRQAEVQARYRKLVEDNRAFNEKLGLPFEWEPGHRVVLSGLSASSWGDGTNRRTVYHVMLKQDLTAGRMKRKAGQFLCSAHVDAFGSSDEMRRHEIARVTCKACLKAAEKFKPRVPDAV